MTTEPRNQPRGDLAHLGATAALGDLAHEAFNPAGARPSPRAATSGAGALSSLWGAPALIPGADAAASSPGIVRETGGRA